MSAINKYTTLCVLVATLASAKTALGDWAEVRHKVQNSVLFIEATSESRDGTNKQVISSTGFVISPHGYGITVAHALPKATADTVVKYQASARTRYGSKFPIEVIRRDDELDVALIVFPNVQTWNAVEAGESKIVPEDARLYVLGFPRSSDLASAEGLLSSYFGPGGRWQTTLPLDYGNSGGPVFDISGRVIGIAAGGLDEARAMTFVIPFDYVRPLRSMVALVPNSFSSQTTTTGSSVMTATFPFSITVDHEEQRQIDQEFCLPESSKVASVQPEIASLAGAGTRVISVTPIPERPNCIQFRAYIAGNGVDRVGPVVVNHKGRGWLSGTLKVQVQ